MMRKRTILGMCILAMCAGPALADWNPGDPDKMLNDPQLPDPLGAAVAWNSQAAQQRIVLADDWMCGGSGAVADIHWWWAFQGDIAASINSFTVSIWSDVPAAQSGLGYSHPGQQLWSQIFLPNQFVTRLYDDQGDQSWIDPLGDTLPSNHVNTYQTNIDFIDQPFQQTFGEIYWLAIEYDLADPLNVADLGWKTSLNHWNDSAVFSTSVDLQSMSWIDMQGFDFAFVITPEPASAALMILGTGLVLIRRRHAS